MRGSTCVLPHSGMHQLAIAEDNMQMHEAMLLSRQRAASVGARAWRPAMLAMLAGDAGSSGDPTTEVGVLLELVQCRRIESELGPRVLATYEAGARARIRRFKEGAPQLIHPDGFMMAEIEIIDDSPGVTENHKEHMATREALRSFWPLLGRLAELQERAGEIPRLTTQTASHKLNSVISAGDVWRPVKLVQELYIRQAGVVHRRVGHELAVAAGEGTPLHSLQSSYATELHNVEEPLASFPTMLELRSGIEVLSAARRLVSREVERLQVELGESSLVSDFLVVPGEGNVFTWDGVNSLCFEE